MKTHFRKAVGAAAITGLLLLAAVVQAAPPAGEVVVGPLPLRNISARGPVGLGDTVLIGGFVIQGDAPQNVLIRAIGPSLQSGNSPVPGRLGDPTLEIFAQGSQTPIATNDNWASSQRADIEATGHAPTDSRESAILAHLAPGLYTAIVRGVNQSTGLGLIEIYDLDNLLNPRLVNLSARGFVGTGDNILIGGVSVGTPPAPEDAVARVALRAIGPSLTAKGVPGALSDPVLQLVNGNGVVLKENDNWGEGSALDLQGTGLTPEDPRESAIVTNLSVGNYTAIVRGKDGGTGVGLFEVYELPPENPPTE